MSGGVPQHPRDYLQEQAIRAESPPQSTNCNHPTKQPLEHLGPAGTSDGAEASCRRWTPTLATIQETGDQRHHEEHVITYREWAHERDTIMRETQSPTALVRDSIPYQLRQREWGAHERDTISYQGGSMREVMRETQSTAGQAMGVLPGEGGVGMTTSSSTSPTSPAGMRGPKRTSSRWTRRWPRVTSSA